MMSVASVFVKNTFLVFKAAEEEQFARPHLCGHRSKSAEICRPSVARDAAVPQAQFESQLCRLNFLLRDGQEQGELSAAVPGAPSLASEKPTLQKALSSASGLMKAVGSNNSVSTMAPEDEEGCEEFGAASQPQAPLQDKPKPPRLTQAGVQPHAQPPQEKQLYRPPHLQARQQALHEERDRLRADRMRNSLGAQAAHGRSDRTRCYSSLSGESSQGSHRGASGGANTHNTMAFGKGFQHCNVPKNRSLAKDFTQAGPERAPTTLMLRNIPNRYTQPELIQELESLGFMGSFDFFYAPIDTGTMGNVGYAFVNFLSPAWAAQCQRLLGGYAFRNHQQRSRKKVATVSVAHLQGLEANIRHYENTAVNVRAHLKQCGPVIMSCIANSLA